MPTNHDPVTHTEDSDDDRSLRAAFYFARKLTIIANRPPKLRIMERMQQVLSSTSPLYKEMLQMNHIADCKAIRDHVEHVLDRQDAQQMSWADLADFLRVRCKDSPGPKEPLQSPTSEDVRRRLLDNARAGQLTSTQTTDWHQSEEVKLSDEAEGPANTNSVVDANHATPDTSVVPAVTDAEVRRALLPDAQQSVWELLEGRAFSAKEIAVKLLGDQCGEDAIRKRIAAIRRKSGRRIENRRGVGYFRPDAPPKHWTGPERESGQAPVEGTETDMPPA